MNEYEIALAQIEAQQPSTTLEPLQATQAQPTVIDGDTLLTQYGSTRIAGIDAPESYSSNKSKIIADKYGVSEEQQTLLGSKAKQKLEDLKGTHLLTNSGVDIYGRILGENQDLARTMIEEGLAVPYTRYDNKLQDTYRKSAEKRKELFGDDSQLKALEAQRQYNLNREAPSTMKMLGQSVDAFQSGLAKTVLDTADAVMDFGKFWGDGNSAFLDEAKKQENIDKWTGYDRREAEFRLNETLHQFKQGEYVDGIINMIPVAPQLAAESLPMMLGMVFGTGKFTALGKAMSGAKTAVEADKIQKAAKLGEKLSYKLADNAGFAAVYAGQLNDRLDERKINQGGEELSAGEVIGVAAEEFLTLGLDRFAFDKVIGVSQGRKALKDIAKLVPDEGKMAIAKKLAETSGRIIAAVGTEAGQEFIQEFGNSLGAELGTKKFGSDIITDERVKQAQIAAIAGGAAGGHMRSNVEALSAAKDFVQDTAAGKTLTDTIDNVYKASELDRLAEKTENLIKDRRKVVDESANAILGSATSSKVGVKNEDGTINIEATIDDAVQRVNAVMGTKPNAFIENQVASDIMNKVLANSKDEASLAKLTEVATKIKEKYGASFNMEEYLENRVNDALTMELDEISYRSENETNDELSRNLFKDTEGEKPADLFKASPEDTQNKIDAVKKVLFSFPIDDEKKTEMLNKFTQGLELIQKYKEQGGKNIDDVRNELRNTGFIRMSGKGEISGKSIKDHETDIVNGITTGKEPSSAMRALKTLVDGRYKKGFGANKVNKLTGEKEINHSQSYVQSIVDDNNAIINMLTKIRTLTDASKHDKAYGSQIDAMIKRLNESNEVVIDSGVSFKKAIDKMKKLGLYEPTKTKQVEKPEVAPQGATIKQDSKPAENGKVSTPTPTVKLNVNDKNKIESVIDKNGKVHEIMNNTLTSVVGTMFRNGMMDILPYRNMKVTINDKTETRRIYRFGNVMYRISQQGFGKAKAINATRVVPANIEMTQEDIAWLKSFESNSMFTQNHVAKQAKTEQSANVKPTETKPIETKVETKPTQPEIDYEAILDTIENTAIEEEVVQEYINPEVLVLEKEATELSAELKKIKTALKKFEVIAESSITERTRGIINGAEARMQEIRARLYEIENELKIKGGESTLGMRLWSKMSKLTQQVLKPINKSREAMGIFDNILMPITNPKADFRTIIESMPIGKRILAGNEEYRAKIIEKLVASRTKLAPLMNIMKTHLTPEKIGSEGKYVDRNMPELKIVNGEVVNAGNPKEKINLLKLILIGNDLSQNQKEIITYGALKALSEIRSISRKADEQMIASMFGIRTDDENIYNILGIVQQGKIPKVVIQAKIGKFILDMMGLKVSRDLDMNLKSKLELSLGMLAIDVIRNTTFEDDKGTVIPLTTESSEFISDEVGERDLIKINETIVDDSFVDAVDAFAYLTNSEDRTHPSVEPIKETSRRKRGTGSVLSDEEVQYKLDQQQQGWKFNKTMDFINRINDNLLKQVLGWKNIKNARDKGLMHAEEVRVQKSINNQIERSIGYAKQYFTLFGKEQSMYMPWDMHASDRYMMEGNFNPDEDKLHRFVANKEDMIGEIDLTNEKDLVLFELAIAQALDYGLDKKSDMTALKNLKADMEITKNGVEFKDTKKGNLYKTVYDIVSSNEVITAKEAKAIKQLVESGEGAHAIQAMVEVAAIDKAIKSKEVKYTSEMTIEADAITSGMALTLLQIGSDKAMQLLAKTGIYTDTMFKAYQALLQYTDMKGQPVTHGVLREAKFIKPVAQKDKQHLATVGIEVANTGDRLLYDFYEHIGEMANREIQKMDTRDNVLVNFVTQVTGKSKDKIIDRAMAKSPVMTTIYGSLINTIKRNLGFEIGKKNIIKAIQSNEKLRNMTFSDFLNAKFEAGSMEWNLKALILFLTEGNKYPPMFETIDDAEDIVTSENQTLGNMVFSNKMNKNVSKIAQDTFGQAFEEAFKDIQEVNQYRNTIKTLSEASFQLFKSRLNRELKKLKTEVVTKNQFEEVLRKMESEGYGYYVKNIYGSMQYLYNNEKNYVSNSKVITKKLDVATGQNAIGYNEDSPISNNKAAPVITIHSIDGFINSRIKEKVLNIKDANLMGMKSSVVNNVRGVYNKSAIESAREHSVLSNMIEHLNFMVSKATKSEKDAIKLTKDELNDFAKGAGLEVQNLKNIALAIDRASKVIKSKRQKNLSGKIHSNHMYISDKSAVTEVNREKTKQIKGLSVSSLRFIQQIFSGDVGEIKQKQVKPTVEPKRSVGEATKKPVQKPKQEPSKVNQEQSKELSNEEEAYLFGQMVNSYGSTDESIGQNDIKLGSEEKYSLVDNITSVLDEMLSREYPDQEDAYAKNLKSTMQSIKEIFEVAGLDKEVTIQKWKTDSVTRGSVDIMSNKIDLAISNTNMMFTESEVLMHELLHIVTEHAIQLNPSLRADIRAVQEAVEKALGKNGYEIFIAHMEQPTSEDVAMAKKAYNYAILGNESEFMAYAMTNQNLFESIQNLRVSKPLFSKMSGDSTFAKVLNTLIGAINKTYSAIRLGGDKVSKIMPSLVQNLVSVQAQMEHMSQNQVETVPTRIENKMKAINDKVESINEAMTGKLKALFKTNTIKLAHFDVLTKISELNGIRHLRDSRLFQDIIYNLVKRTNDEDVADFYQLYRQIKKVQESDKEKLKYNITVVLKESLKSLSDSELKATKRTLLDTDVHTLLKSGMSINEVAELMSDDVKLGSEIKTREANIRKLANKKLAGAYLKQAENLGYYMVNRQDKIVNAMKNAHNIVNAYFDTNMVPLRKQITNKEQLIEQVDILATLNALKFSGVENKKLTVEAIAKSKEGLVQAINTLGNAMTIYDKELFEKQRGITNVDYRVKGYSYQQSTEEKSMFMVTEDEMNWYRKLPWMKVVKDVSHLSLTNNKTKKYLIIANNIDVGRTKGAMDIIGFKRSGIDVKDIMYSDGLHEENVRDTIDKLKRGYNNKVYNDVDMNKEGSELSPILDMNGEIVNYKFDMSHEDKVAYMSLNDNIIDAVAGTLTNTHAKTSAIGENMKVVNWIVNDSDKHYKENPSAFTIIEPSSKYDKSKTAEMWKIIPEYTRNYIKMKTGEHKLIVRTDMLNDVLGYKDFSLSDIDWVKKNHPVLSRHILELESLWKNIVGKYKKIVVTLMGEVVFSNMFSNMMMAIQHGISPARFVKKIKEGWDTLDAYEKDSNLIVQLKVRKVAGGKELDGKIKALEEKLKRNPMHVFVQDGLFAPIVEDINAGMYTDKNAVDRMIDKTMKRVPDKLKGVFDLLYVNDNTSLYATMLKLVQYSDIISRYAVHEALINKGMSNQEAMNYLDQLFVNYNYNENRYLKYMNDVGLVMFTKYFFRTPKALIQMASKYPTFTYGTQLLQTVTGLNVVDAADSYYNPMVSFFARFQSPSDMISEVIDPNIQGIFSFPELVR